METYNFTSIIIPIYNVELYIKECLQSVVNQTMTDGVECILVDDCGSDNSVAIAESFIESYKGDIKFSLIHHDKNRGLSAARNTGIKAANGEYLYFLDSDDTIMPNCIETLNTIKNKYEIDLIQAAYLDTSPSVPKMNTTEEYTKDKKLIKRTLLDYDKNPVMAQNRLVRRSLIVDNNLWFKEGIVHEDNHWTFFLAKHVKTMAFTPEKLYFYRETPGSITNKKNIQKESHAFNTMIRDFCNYMDNFEIGAQKRWIFLHLLLMKNNKYYDSLEQFNELTNLFLSKNSFIEKILAYLCLKRNIHNKLNNKLINILQRIYMLC